MEELCCKEIGSVTVLEEFVRRTSREDELVVRNVDSFDPGETGVSLIVIDLLRCKDGCGSESSSKTRSPRAWRAATTALCPTIAGTAVTPIIAPTRILAGPIRSRNLVSMVPVCALRIRLNMS